MKNEAFELVEASGLTKMRELATRWLSRRSGVSPTSPVLLRIGFLLKGTTAVKTSKGTVENMVSKPYDVFETHKDGKPLTVITLNQRLGLNKMGDPLEHPERVKRCMGALLDALVDLSIPREKNKKGVPIRTRAHTEALNNAGWIKWDQTLTAGDAFSSSIAPEVDFAADAFEPPKPGRSFEGRTVYKAEIRDGQGNLITSLSCAKSLFDAYSDKASGLHISFIAVEAAAAAKADKIAKDAKKLHQAEKDEAEKQAILDKIAEDIELVNSGD